MKHFLCTVLLLDCLIKTAIYLAQLIIEKHAFAVIQHCLDLFTQKSTKEREVIPRNFSTTTSSFKIQSYPKKAEPLPPSLGAHPIRGFDHSRLAEELLLQDSYAISRSCFELRTLEAVLEGTARLLSRMHNAILKKIKSCSATMDQSGVFALCALHKTIHSLLQCGKFICQCLQHICIRYSRFFQLHLCLIVDGQIYFMGGCLTQLQYHLQKLCFCLRRGPL